MNPPPLSCPTSIGREAVLRALLERVDAAASGKGSLVLTFNFDVTGVATVGTDQIKSTVSLMAGECKTVFIRSTVEPVPATILVTEQVSAGVLLTGKQIITATTSHLAISLAIATAQSGRRV